MLRSLTKLNGYKLRATDGDIGKVKEWFFDDFHWQVRYLVADTGNWLVHRRVLIAPSAFATIDDAEQAIRLNITKQRVESSPPIEAHLPVSKQREQEYFNHFGWAWYGTALWGVAPPSLGAVSGAALRSEGPSPAPQQDTHLRSTKEVTGYRIQALDEHIGHVGDFFVEDATWIIQYLLADLGELQSGKNVLVLPGWVDRVSWRHAELRLTVKSEIIRNAPPFDPAVPLTRETEEKLFRAYYDKAM